MAKVPKVDSLETRRDEVSGYKIFSRFCQSAQPGRPPVVLVHGLSMSSRYLIPTAERMAVNYHVYVPDLPGFGRSQQPRSRLQKALSIEQLVDALRAWLDHLGIGPAVFIGNSMGCQFVVEFALRFPERVLRAVLIGPTMDPAAPNQAMQVGRGAFHLLFEPLTFWAVAALDYARYGFRRTFQTLGDGLSDPMRMKLGQVSAPTLVVRGEKDKIVSQRWADEVAQRLPRGRIVVIQGAGHVVNFDSPDPLVKEIERFLADLSEDNLIRSR